MKLKFRQLFILLAGFLSLAGSVFSNGLPWNNKTDNTAGNFLLMSDIHFDPFADPKLVKSLIAAPVEKWESILESASHEPFALSGKDSNYSLMVSALSEAAKKGPYDFAIITGDYLVHESRDLFEPIGGKDEQAYEDFVTKTEIFVAREVQKQLAGTPVYFSLGNNDSECGDYMMAAHTTFLEAITHEWRTLDASPDAQKTMADAGYYAIAHPTLPHTELIVLNDIYWSNRYTSDSCHSQPNDQAGEKEMTWLKDQLSQAKSGNQKVILVMHIPPQGDINGIFKELVKGGKKKKAAQKKGGKIDKKSGDLFWGDQYEAGFVQLMKDFSDTVEVSYAGHTHMDDFRILKDDQGNAVLVTHICPAVSPIRFNNPGFQVMEYDKTTGDIRDMATFYLKNLATAKGSQDGQWDLEYDFDSTYGLTGYNAASLTSLTDTLDTDGDKLSAFAKYYDVSAPELIPMDAWKKLNDLRLSASQKEVNESLK
jgi:sphingomyelin phosphodiesterase acid-like 3